MINYYLAKGSKIIAMSPSKYTILQTLLNKGIITYEQIDCWKVYDKENNCLDVFNRDLHENEIKLIIISELSSYCNRIGYRLLMDAID